MTRNPNPFTERQIRLLESIHEKLKCIHDPDPDVITHEDYQWYTEQTKEFGKIPKLTFKPGSTQKKAELIVKAELDNPDRQEQISTLRAKYGIKKARNNKAMLFESEWNNLMFKAKKAAFTLALINQLFATHRQSVADPVRLLQEIVMEEYASQIKGQKGPIHDKDNFKMVNSKESKGIKPYDRQLADLE